MIEAFALLILCTSIAKLQDANELKSRNESKIGKDLYSDILFFILCMIMVLYAGLRTRYDDTVNYINGFNNIKTEITTIDWTLSKCPGFTIFQMGIKRIFGENYHIFLISASLITVTSYLCFFRKYATELGACIFIFISTGVYTFSFAAIKQAMAISIAIWAIPLFLNKQYLKGTIVLLAAMLFHPYVVVLASCLFLSESVWNKKTIIMIIGTVVFMIFFSSFVELLQNISGSFGESYSEDVLSSGGVGIARAVFKMIIPLCTLFFRREINSTNDKMICFSVNASMASACIMFLSTFGGATLIGRIPAYFDPFVCLSYPIIKIFMRDQNHNRERNKIMFIGLVLAMLVFFYVWCKKYTDIYCRGNIFGCIFNHESIGVLFK